MCSGESFDESLGQGAFFVETSKHPDVGNLPLKQLQMAHISQFILFGRGDFFLWLCHIDVSTKTSMIFAGVIGISYHKNSFSFWHLQNFRKNSWLKKIVAPNSRWRVGSRWISLKKKNVILLLSENCRCSPYPAQNCCSECLQSILKPTFWKRRCGVDVVWTWPWIWVLCQFSQILSRCVSGNQTWQHQNFQ